jgi:hypothetical protein
MELQSGDQAEHGLRDFARDHEQVLILRCWSIRFPVESACQQLHLSILLPDPKASRIDPKRKGFPEPEVRGEVLKTINGRWLLHFLHIL